MEPELKPCPFCGGEATYGGVWGPQDYAYAGCMSCRIFARTKPLPSGSSGGYAALAVVAWNRRIASPPPPATPRDED